MDFKQLATRANQIRNKYSEFEIKKTGKTWGREQIMEGMVGDVGDLMKLVMAKEGYRNLEDVDQKIAEELADVLYCILVLSEKYGIDLETKFLESMEKLEKRIEALENH